jgi:prepilin-type N-terminal cleavage/methylation domain-containing protein
MNPRRAALSAHPAGVTLVEVMMALFVGSLIAGMAWNLFQGSLHGYRRGLREVALTQEARAVLSIITRDIQRAVTTDVNGLQGLRPAGVALTGDLPQTGWLMFTAAVPAMRETEGAPAEPRVTLQRIRYYLEPASPEGRPEQLDIRIRESQSGESGQGSRRKLVLKRAVAPLGHEAAERIIPLGERLRRLELRYFDGHAWSEDWGRPGRPRALEIAIVLQDAGPDSSPQRFATIVALE